MIQMMVIGFFVCLGVKAAMDMYDGAKKILLSDEVKQGIKDGAHTVHERVDSTLGIHKEEHEKKSEAA